ncbi:MAG: hypothetical protein MR658_02530 [Campylobacter sp.]|uniref:hypothetical protein n=1 Tax=Campylobacter sp. TaxID=205 RepID=UPI002A5835E1|nr:hypothetical protein [Campylobacter sp.]MCI6177699.1 hypothetical protein [Campylobacter sp.]MCI7501349.1 hypothetical protein [Campylobacter sp.]MDD7091023.1 hypothetical protein [Campylobacteraceae bacterium]MDY5284620.1 hypothetical protein [Campylobacter sp.]
MTNIQVQKTLKKDILHLSLGILMLVLLPISAFIYHNLEAWYYILPCFLGVVFFKGLWETYMLYKTYEHKK